MLQIIKTVFSSEEVQRQIINAMTERMITKPTSFKLSHFESESQAVYVLHLSRHNKVFIKVLEINSIEVSGGDDATFNFYACEESLETFTEFLSKIAETKALEEQEILIDLLTH